MHYNSLFIPSTNDMSVFDRQMRFDIGTNGAMSDEKMMTTTVNLGVIWGAS